jgi:hypothetical protein
MRVSETVAIVTGGGGPGCGRAISRLTTTLDWLAASDNIRVNCLIPDRVATPKVKQYVAALTPRQRREQRVPARLTTPDEIAGAVVRLVADDRLAGRALVWWNDDVGPRLIANGDPGSAALEPC